jgi:MFS family permease
LFLTFSFIIAGVYAGQFLSIGIFQLIVMRLAKRVGRVQMMIGSRLVGLCIMVIIIIGDGNFWNIQWLTATLHVFRTGIMNSPSALSPSLLSDYVGKESRGKWQAMDMITSFGWSGSSLFGAWVLDSLAGKHE